MLQSGIIIPVSSILLQENRFSPLSERAFFYPRFLLRARTATKARPASSMA